MQVAMSFGGRFWSIDSRDMNFGPVGTGSDICLGGFFEFVPYSNSTGNPNWIVGVAFLKNVYSIFRYQPAGIGFAELSNTRGVASGEWCCPAVFCDLDMYSPRCPERKREWKQH